MWSDGEPIDPSPTIDQAVHGGFPWLEIQCTRCKTPNDADQAAMEHPPTTLVHDLAIRLRRRKCARRPRRPSATLLQLKLACSRGIPAQKTDMCNLCYADLRIMPTIGPELSRDRHSLTSRLKRYAGVCFDFKRLVFARSGRSPGHGI
jgi:phage FluMu protein Com